MPSPTVLSDFDGILKQAYLDVSKDVVPNLTPLLANVEKAKPGGVQGVELNGNGVKWHVKLSRDVGMVSSDGGYLGVDSIPVNKQASESHKRLYVTRQIDGAAIVLTQGREGSYTSAIRELVRGMKTAIKLGMEEQLQGNGTFTKAVIGTVTDTTHVVVSSPYGVTGAGQGGLLVDQGDYVAVLDQSNSWAVLGVSKITSASNSGDNCTLVLETAISGMAATDILVPASTATQNSYNQAINGLINITNRGNAYQTLHGQSSGTYARWDAIRWVAGTDVGAADQITEFDIQRLITKAHSRYGEDPTEKPSEWLLIGPPSLKLRLMETMAAQRQFNMGTMDLKGGFKSVMVAGLPFVADGFCPVGTLYLLHLKSLTWFDAADWGQVSYGSDNAWRPISGRDAYETSYRFIGNFGALARTPHGSITGYTDTERYSIAA